MIQACEARRFLPTCALIAGLSVVLLCEAPSFGEGASPSPRAAASFAGELLRHHPYLLEQPERERLDEINRRLREVEHRMATSRSGEERDQAGQEREVAIGELVRVVEKCRDVQRVSVVGPKPDPPAGGRVLLPGDAGALLLRVESDPGPAHFVDLIADYAAMPDEELTNIEAPIAAVGTTWVVVGLRNMPVKRTTLRIDLRRPDKTITPWRLDVLTPEKARLRVKVVSEDGDAPTPAMVRMIWVTGGFADRPPSNALDLSLNFESQGATVSGFRRLRVPGPFNGEAWCCPGPFDMAVPPGEWRIMIRRGVEFVPISDEFTAAPGQTVEKTYRVRRWTDMARLGWYSGDDHVHARLMSDDDARRLMAWIQAEDLHLANVVKMGDISGTWFEQRGFGKEYRVIDGDYVLSPGQECPRTHEQLGHTLAMNTTDMVRNTDTYLCYDLAADGVHAQGGLWGYAHVATGQFEVHRDMTLNVPAGRCDFGEILQFGKLGTELYYEFLNTGFKMTASAGSDVPWGGTVGEARVYADAGRAGFSPDAWFDAVRRGRTFVTDGPMLEFHVDEAGPGDEIRVADDRKLRVRARAWGDPSRMLPLQLELVRQGDVIRTARTGEGRAEVALDAEIDSADGFWIAARARGGDGTAAHTTPIYVVRDGLRFWRFEAVDELIARRLASLDQMEKIIAQARSPEGQAKALTDRAVQQLDVQGEELLKRVRVARTLYADLKEIARREAARRAAAN
jgi:hypothetical protein